jgi:RsiW-degrading membrane proteinase PrsW (M82 family)
MLPAPMLAVRWLLASLLPAVLAAYLVWRTDPRREPWLPSVGTFLLGIVAAVPVFYLQEKAAAWTGLDVRASVAGDAGALLFQFALISPMREAAKVAASWPAFQSKHFEEPYDGLVYASLASMGFAVYDGAWHLWGHAATGIWVARVLLALPAHLFFASLWGYALGRAKTAKRPGPLFPATWLLATLGHAFYAHLVYGRGPGALVAAAPLLAAMGLGGFFIARDLRTRGERNSRAAGFDPALGGRLSIAPLTPISSFGPPSLGAVREALRRADRPIMLRWIGIGMLVTIGAMIVGLAASIAFGHYAHVDFAAVDEHDVSTTAPVALLGAGVLAAFPLSGFLVARASGVPTLLEPALSAGLAIVASLVLLGLAAPIAMVFALAFSPIALALACAGAWVGRGER